MVVQSHHAGTGCTDSRSGITTMRGRARAGVVDQDHRGEERQKGGEDVDKEDGAEGCANERSTQLVAQQPRSARCMPRSGSTRPAADSVRCHSARAVVPAQRRKAPITCELHVQIGRYRATTSIRLQVDPEFGGVRP
jgi:hypothetical protein